MIIIVRGSVVNSMSGIVRRIIVVGRNLDR